MMAGRVALVTGDRRGTGTGIPRRCPAVSDVPTATARPVPLDGTVQ